MYFPLSSFCSEVITTALMSSENTTRGLADNSLPSLSQTLSVTWPVFAWQLRLAVLLPAMRTAVGPVMLVPEIGSVSVSGTEEYCYS